MKNVFAILLIILASVFSTCALWDKSDVKIERFEYLDIPRSTPVAGDSLASEAYLIHGYSRWHEEEIHEITDQYACDSIIPYRTLHRTRRFTFFKKTKNTNRENFQVRPKHKNIYARSHDKLYSYILHVGKDSVVFSMSKYFYGLSEPDPPPQDFHCD